MEGRRIRTMTQKCGRTEYSFVCLPSHTVEIGVKVRLGKRTTTTLTVYIEKNK